jgi:hypothetical protein
MAYRSSGRFWQARHPPRYAAFLTQPSPSFGHSSRAFGERLKEVRGAMEALASSLPPDELNRTGFRLYEGLRPEVPQGVEGWGAKAVLDIERINRAAQ